MPPTFNLQRLILPFAAFAIMVMASSTTSANPITNNGVPEQASLFLMGSGLIGVAAIFRRRLKHRQTEAQE